MKKFSGHKMSSTPHGGGIKAVNNDITVEIRCQICKDPVKNSIQTKCCGEIFCEECNEIELKFCIDYRTNDDINISIIEENL